MDYRNKKVLIAGLGSTGLSMLAFFQQCGTKLLAVYDEKLSESKIVELKQNDKQLMCFSGSLATVLSEYEFDVLAISPGISVRQVAVERFKQLGGEVVGDVELLARLLAHEKSKVIAITGSNGKTTVTSLVGHLCRQSGLDTVVAGNIGMPVLEAYRQRAGKVADVWVLELSSFQLETIDSLDASAATVLNISEDHLDRYENLLDYAYAKAKILRGNGVQVLNADDVLCRAMKHEHRPIKWFSLNKTTDYFLDNSNMMLKQNNQDLIAMTQVPLQGQHNMANVLAALALCEAIGLNAEMLLPHVQSFKGLPHRVEKVGEKNGVVFIDDSKGTNVGATVAAIAGFNQPLLLIAGGVGKGQDFSTLGDVLVDKVRAVFLIGEAAQQIREDLNGTTVPIFDCETLPEAVQRAYQMANAGDAVLLSPACASFDMFNDYAHRAQVFVEAYHAL